MQSMNLQMLRMVPGANFALIVSLLLIWTVQVRRTYCDEIDNASALEIGSCFKERNPQGQCFGLLSKTWSKSECCQKNGFFVNRLISEQEYLIDHLLRGSGTPSCVNPCDEDAVPTCAGYKCAIGHTCQLVNDQPKCVCQLSCKRSDYEGGPICSTDLRKFDNLCMFKQAVCLSPLENLQETPCPMEEMKCAPDSVYPGRCPTYLDATDLRNKRLEEKDQEESSSAVRQLHPMLDNELGRQLWSLGMSLFNKRSRVYHMRRRKVIGPLAVDKGGRLYKRSTGEFNIPPSLQLTRASVEGNLLHCPVGQYCLVQQYDSRPTCISLAPTEKVVLSGCPEEAVFPEPMCGVDNQTYTDACQLRVSSLKRQLEIRIAYKGPCREDAKCSSVRCPRDQMTCRPHHRTGQPVCLDCKDLPKNCNAYAVQSTRTQRAWRHGLSRRSSSPGGNSGSGTALGDPRWNGITVTFGWPAVCGSNGRTYVNSCFLHVFNCFSLEFVDLSKPGLCPGLM